jgi:hypothetical protein
VILRIHQRDREADDRVGDLGAKGDDECARDDAECPCEHSAARARSLTWTQVVGLGAIRLRVMARVRSN